MRKGKASEELASSILEAIGFEIIERNKSIEINGKVVAEVDIFAKAPCSYYAIEVKAGKVDVGAVRQAYANGEALGATPMVMGVGWSNEEAKYLAEKLGVKYLMFDDLYVSTREDLYEIVRLAIEDTISDLLSHFEPDEECCELLKYEDSSEEAIEVLRRLKRKGLLPRRGSWRLYRALAKICCELSTRR